MNETAAGKWPVFFSSFLVINLFSLTKIVPIDTVQEPRFAATIPNIDKGTINDRLF